MTVISLSIRAAADPLGTPLVTLTDEDVATFEMRVAENSLGAGSFTIRRDHPDATAANLAEDNYVVVTIPAIDDDPVFGFFLQHHDDTVLAQGEEGAEQLVREGPGSLAIVGRAAFLDDHYAPVPPASDDRGSANEIAGYWRWQHKQYGQIFKRLIEEGQNEPGVPLADVTTDFDRDVDSDGVDWPAIDRDVRFEIGTDGLTFMDRFAETGEVFIRCSPELLVQARQNRGTDRTSGSFASGKVRLVKGVNIQTELVRSADTTMAATHAIVIGMENNVVRVVSPSYTSGPGKWVTIHYDNSNDTGVLEKVGAEALRRGVADLQELTLEIRAGDAPLSGHYLPFKHFDTGDVITVHTGTDDNDYNEQSERVRAFTIALREATDDTMHGSISGDEMAARSLIVGLEMGGAAGTFSIDLNVKVEEKGCGGCPPPPPIVIIPGSVDGLHCTGLDTTDYAYTPGGTYAAPTLVACVGGFTATSTATMQYWATGGGASEYPNPGVVYGCTDGGVCRFLFPSGGVMYTSGGGAVFHRINLIGPGTLTIHTSVHPGGLAGGPGCVGSSSVTMTAAAYASGTGGIVLVDTDTQTVGTDMTIVIPDDGYCAHYVDINGSNMWGDGGFTWAPSASAITPPVGGQPVEVHTTGDGTTTSYETPDDPFTSDPLPYTPESLEIEVGGLDWTPAITETDPAAGTYDLAYPPPLGSTVRVHWIAP